MTQLIHASHVVGNTCVKVVKHYLVFHFVMYKHKINLLSDMKMSIKIFRVIKHSQQKE